MSRKRPYCVSIAGFDPSGGAGLLADVKTFEQLRTIGLAVQTCNTIQTEEKFSEVIWTPIETILKQLEVLLERYNPTFFKIGIIENDTVLIQILEKIKAHNPKATIIWDPVLKPTFTSSNKIEEDRFSNSIVRIIELVDWVTPNTDEFNLLFPKGVGNNVRIYLKGGHLTTVNLAEYKPELGRDYLIQKGKVNVLNSKIETSLSKHGTGCIFSSALCGYLALKFPALKASYKAKHYVAERIVSNPTLLSYHK